MTQTQGRWRSYLHFFLAIAFYFAARMLAARYTASWASEPLRELGAQLMTLLLLLLGYAWLGSRFSPGSGSLTQLGWPFRSGWRVEVGLGIACGWAFAVICLLPTLVSGALAVMLDLHGRAWAWLLCDLLFFALLAAVEENAFRGYGFRRFADVVGPYGAAFGFAAIAAIAQALVPGSLRASVWNAFLLSLVLTSAMLRTQALWVSWGINFAWKASRAVLFGLAVAGDSQHSHVVFGASQGRYWITGGGFGLEASWLTILLMVIAWPFLFRVTRDLEERYNQPEIVAAGIPLDLVQECKPTVPVLVQIQPLESHPAPASPEPESQDSAAS